MQGLWVAPVTGENRECVDRMWAVLNETLPGLWSRKALESELSQGASHYWSVVDAEGSVASFGGFWLIEDEAHLVLLVVHPARQGKGIGSALLAYLLRQARSSARRMTLEVRETNRPALAVYAKYGFEILGRRPGYYGNEAALILWTPRIDTPGYLAHLDQLAKAEQFILAELLSEDP